MGTTQLNLLITTPWKVWKIIVTWEGKVARGCLATRHMLQTRGVHCSDRCMHFESSHENGCHVFFGCTKLEQVWSATGLWHHTREYGKCGWVCSFILSVIRIPTSHTTSWFCNDSSVYMEDEKRWIVEWRRNFVAHLNAYGTRCLTSMAASPRTPWKERTWRIL